MRISRARGRLDPRAAGERPRCICSGTAWAGRWPRSSRRCGPSWSGRSPCWRRPSTSWATTALLNLWTDRTSLRRRRRGRRLRQLPGLVSPGLLSLHEPRRQPDRKEHLVLRTDGRPAEHDEPLRARELGQRRHPGGRRDVSRVRQESLPAQPAGEGRAVAGRPPRRPRANHLPALALDRQERSPGRPGVDGRYSPPRRNARHRIDGDRRWPRRPGGERPSTQDLLACGDALAGRTLDTAPRRSPAPDEAGQTNT